MINPHFDTSFRGYNTDQVDDYIKKIKEDLVCANVRYDKLFEENQSLKKELLSIIDSINKKIDNIDSSQAEHNSAENSESEKDFEFFGKQIDELKELLK